jgi:hypothetical protein
MKNIKLGIGVLSFAAFAAFSAAAESDTGTFAARGVGAETCESVTANIDAQGQQRLDEVASWLGGYVSYQNRITKGYFDVSPIQNNAALAIVVNSVCRNNPSSLLEGVAATVVAAYRPLGSTEETDLVTLSNSAGSVVVRQSVLKKVQDYLVAQDLLEKRQADGQFGPKTSEAILNYQKSKGLSENGLPEAFTLLSIAQDMK